MCVRSNAPGTVCPSRRRMPGLDEFFVKGDVGLPGRNVQCTIALVGTDPRNQN